MITRNLFLLAGLFIALSLNAQDTNKKSAKTVSKPARAALTSRSFSGLDTAFARILKDWKAAGFAVAVVEKDKIVYAQGFGYKDVENRVPVTANTVFAIGSCTKAFTSSIIGLLGKDGSLDIDKPVKTYLPELNFYDNEMNNNVTLRDMMCHRTGVSRYDYSWYYFPTLSRDTLMRRMQYMEPSAPLRQKWQYNNFMFMLQGLVAERLTHKTWEQNVQERILAPLGMTNTTVDIEDWMKAPDKAYGYDVRKDSIIHRQDFYNINGMAPAGAINSSVNDMAKWVTVWLNGGKYMGKEILPAPYVNEAMSSQMVMSGALPGKAHPDAFLSNYGFGWMLSSYRGHYRVEHGGNIDGFSASTCFFPSDSIGIIVLSNQNGSAVPSLVRNLVADRALGLRYQDWESEAIGSKLDGDAKAKQAATTVPSRKKYGTTPSHPAVDYTGIYTAPGTEQFEVELSHDSLFMVLPASRFWLQHFHYDVYRMLDKTDLEFFDSTDESGAKFMFLADENGDIVSASIPLEGTKPIIFTKSAKMGPLTRDSLVKYTGDYSLNGVIVKVYIKGDNTLYVYVPNQPEYELVPNGRDKFNLKVLKGYSVEFSGNAKGEVSGISFVQPNGVFKATKVEKGPDELKK